MRSKSIVFYLLLQLFSYSVYSDSVEEADSKVLGFAVLLGCKNLNLEYGAYPKAEEGESVQFTVGLIVRELLGVRGKLNTKNLRMMDVQTAKPRQSGGLTKGESKTPWLVDAWGRPFRVIMDVDGDGKIAHPFEDGFLEATVIVWSVGKDGLDGTEDDVTTW